MLDIRSVLRLDALASAGLGAVLAAGAGLLDRPLGLPAAFSVPAGIALLVWGALVSWVAMHPTQGRVTEVALLNVGYVLASVAFAFGFDGLTGWGTAVVLVQAAAVAVLAALQLAGTRTIGRSLATA